MELATVAGAEACRRNQPLLVKDGPCIRNQMVEYTLNAEADGGYFLAPTQCFV